jgi:hypothetical protein
MKRDVAIFLLPNGTADFSTFKRFPEKTILRKIAGNSRSPPVEYAISPAHIYFTNMGKRSKKQKHRLLIFDSRSPFPLPLHGTMEELRLIQDAMSTNRSDTSREAWYGSSKQSYLLTVMASIMSASIAALVTYVLAVHQLVPHP